MQLIKHSLIAATLLTSAVQAEDFVSIQYLNYDEADDRTSVKAPSFMVEKDFGLDFTLNINGTFDAVSGASQTYYDASSGASAFSRNLNVKDSDITYGNIEYHENRRAGGATLISRLVNRDEITLGANYSEENDFYSYEGSANYMHWMGDNKNQTLSFGLSYQYNEILVECSFNPACERPNTISGRSGASEKKTNNVLSSEVSFRQNINSDSYIKGALFAISELGFLSNPYLNIVENFDGAQGDIIAERRPDSKLSYGAAVHYGLALSDEWITKMNYRLYSDDWGLLSNTVDIDLLYQLNDDWLLKAGTRYYTQNEADFYGGEVNSFTSSDTYASSDHRLAAFDALSFKAGFEVHVTDEFIYNLDFGTYDQSKSTLDSQLSAIYIVTGIRYNF